MLGLLHVRSIRDLKNQTVYQAVLGDRVLYEDSDSGRVNGYVHGWNDGYAYEEDER